MFVLDFTASDAASEAKLEVDLTTATKVCPAIVSLTSARHLARSVISDGDVWVFVTDVQVDSGELLTLLDAGISKLVISQDFLSAADSADCLPSERLILRLPSFSPDSFTETLKAAGHLVSGIMIDLSDLKVSSLSSTSLLDVVYKAAKGRGPGFFSFVLAASQTFGLQWTASIDKMGVDVIITESLVSLRTDEQVTSSLDLGTLLSSFLETDRPDGLFSTIVVDEQGIALGLCYSSTESIREALRTGDGVYFSRSRGLWHKGSTSGATQKLLSIALDCDRDALRFTVRQKNPGKNV
jgi:phosphoribosyl-ATP pyrophosphohydrolase/phosphoribosyl-AMP cyclohydrolase/histidinol dehydrogenase